MYKYQYRYINAHHLLARRWGQTRRTFERRRPLKRIYHQQERYSISHIPCTRSRIWCPSFRLCTDGDKRAGHTMQIFKTHSSSARMAFHPSYLLHAHPRFAHRFASFRLRTDGDERAGLVEGVDAHEEGHLRHALGRRPQNAQQRPVHLPVRNYG